MNTATDVKKSDRVIHHVTYRRFVVALSLMACLLAILGIGFTAYEWSLGVNNTYWAYQASEIFSLTHEGNVPTWFSTLLLVSVAGLSVMIALCQTEARTGWWGLGGLFLYLSIDEAAALHETFTTPLREALNLGGYLYFGWVLVGVPFVLIMALLFLPFVWQLPRRTQITIVIAAMLYLIGALGIEVISANLWYQNDGTSLLYSAIGTVEEFCEMQGVIVLLYGLLHYIEEHIGSVQFVFYPPDTAR
jgi:hypothetical protein